MVRIRKDSSNHVTIIDQRLVRDSRLTWKARGIFAYLWSQSDGWDFNINEVSSHSPDGRDSLRAGLEELEKYGYLERKRTRNKLGQVQKSAWLLHEKPISGFPTQAEPTQGKPTLDNPPQRYHQEKIPSKEDNTNTHSASENALSVSVLEESFEALWKDYPNKKGKRQAFNHYKTWRKKSVNNTDEYLAQKLKDYLAYCSQNSWYHPMNGSTWFNGRFDDELQIEPTGGANQHEGSDWGFGSFNRG